MVNGERLLFVVRCEENLKDMSHLACLSALESA